MINVQNEGAGARAFVVFAMADELLIMLYEMRLAVLFLIVLVAADLRFGRQESEIRYKAACERGDENGKDTHRWRSSRAIRRTTSKFLDYIVFIFLGTLIGRMFLESVGIPHIYGTIATAALIFCCEVQSIISHFLFLHRVSIETKTVTGFLKSFAVAFAKKKNEDVGEALDEAFKEQEKKEEEENKEVKEEDKRLTR